MLVSTQTGFEMIKSRLCVGALMTGLCLKAKQYWVCGDSSELGFGGVLAVPCGDVVGTIVDTKEILGIVVAVNVMDAQRGDERGVRLL